MSLFFHTPSTQTAIRNSAGKAPYSPANKSGNVPAKITSSRSIYPDSDKKDIVIDNLWHNKSDVEVYSLIGAKPALMKVKQGASLLSKDTKIQGYIVYYLPKDKKGNLTGKPQRFLCLQKNGNSTNDYIKADSLVPYYEDIVKNKNKWIALGGADTVRNAEAKLSTASFTGISDANNWQGAAEYDNYMFRNGLNNYVVSDGSKSIFRRGLNTFQEFDDNLPIIECNTRQMGCSIYDLSNGGLLDDDISFKATNRIENYQNASGIECPQGCSCKGRSVTCRGTSKMLVPATVAFNGCPQGCLCSGNVYDCRNAPYPSYNTNNQYSNTTGDTIPDYLPQRTTSIPTNNSVPDIVDAKTMNEIYQKAYSSGKTKKSFNDWVTSDAGKTTVDSLLKLTDIFVNRQPVGFGNVPPDYNPNQQSYIPPYDPKKESSGVTILGMSPAGLIIVGGLVVTALVLAFTNKGGAAQQVAPTIAK